MTLTPRQVRELLGGAGRRPSRALGQNFVVDPNTVRRIARLAGVGPGDRVVEIGAGLGSLTLALAETEATVTAIEIDDHLVPLLRQVVEGTDVRVVHADASRLDWDTVLGPAGTGRDIAASHLVANLPYNIATPLVLDLLDGEPRLDPMLVMVQREVAERLAAGVGDAAYGIPSVKVAYWAEATVVGDVGPDVFWPRPNVESALVRLVRRPAPATDADPDVLFDLVRSAFGQRRKMLRRSLAAVVAPECFAEADVDPAARPEQLDVEAWGRLARTLAR